MRKIKNKKYEHGGSVGTLITYIPAPFFYEKKIWKQENIVFLENERKEKEES